MPKTALDIYRSFAHEAFSVQRRRAGCRDGPETPPDARPVWISSGAIGHARPDIVVVRLSRVEIHASARRHGVRCEDIDHAVTHSVSWTQLGEDPPRYLLVGPGRAGNLLELVVVDMGGEELVIHAMPLRRSTAEELFGDER